MASDLGEGSIVTIIWPWRRPLVETSQHRGGGKKNFDEELHPVRFDDLDIDTIFLGQ